MTPVPIQQFAHELTKILPIITKEFLRRQVAEFCHGKITIPKFVVMEYLANNPDNTMSDLANFMQVSMPTMTGIVNRLVRDGYVKRVLDGRDRRVVKVKLSPKGSELLGRILAKRSELIIHTFGKISAHDRSDYLRILTQVRDILVNENSGKAK